MHGPVIGYATVNGRKVAISYKRSSYGKDVLDLLFFRRLSTGQVHSPQSFFKAASLTPQTFNSFYMDSKHIAEYTSGPASDAGRSTSTPACRPWGPASTSGAASCGKDKHIHGVDPNAAGTMVNWNNISAHGFGAADDDWGGNGSAARVDMLNRELTPAEDRTASGTLATVTSAMNAAATQDVRAIDTVPLLAKLLKGTTAPNRRPRRCCTLLIGWRQHGGSRLDLNNDGEIDDPGAAIMDTAWPKIANAFMKPQIGPQLDELELALLALRPAAGRPVQRLVPVLRPRHRAGCWAMQVSRSRSQNRYCGARQPEESARRRSGTRSPTPARQLTASRAPRTRTRGAPTRRPSGSTSCPGLLPTTMRYTNRPSGIQQVISFNGHR